MLYISQNSHYIEAKKWLGAAWSGLEWPGVAWSGLEWPGAAWSGLEWP